MQKENPKIRKEGESQVRCYIKMFYFSEEFTKKVSMKQDVSKNFCWEGWSVHQNKPKYKIKIVLKIRVSFTKQKFENKN